MLQGYEIVQGNSGGSFTGGGWKIGLHSTEGSTANGAIGAYRKYNSWPHFTIEAKTGRKIQHVELNTASRAAENRSGGVETNRANIIQIELVGFANESHNWSNQELDLIASVLQDIRNAGIGFALQAPRFYGSGEGIILASYNSPIRMQGGSWTNYSGIVGHQHFPENAHWDPGKINIQYILDKLGGGVITGPSGPVSNPKPVDNALGLGDNNDAVRRLQQRLADLGYPIAVDGDFGNQTRDIVVQFQSSNGLVADGLVGAKTQEKLDQASPIRNVTSNAPVFRATVKKGSKGEIVSQVQQRLKDRGWNIVVDGAFGNQTYNIVKQYQAEKGLMVDGIVGPVSFRSLWESPIN